MNKDDVIRMAREAGFCDASQLELNVEWTCVSSEIQDFAKLVAAAEREECAKICDSLNEDWDHLYVESCADAIRARGQA